MKTKSIVKKIWQCLLVMLLVLAVALPASADTWKQKYLVKKSVHKKRNINEAVMDTNGNKFFHTYEATTDDGFNDSFLYEYTHDGKWVNHTNSLKNLVSQNASWGNISNFGIFALFADQSGNVWVATQPCMLTKYDGENWSVESPETVWEQVLGQSVTGINGGYFYNLFGDAQGNLYSIASVSATGIGSEESVRMIKRTASTGLWSEFIPQDATVINYANQSRYKGAFNDTTGDVWLYHYYGATSGAYRYHSGSWTNYTTDDGLPSNSLNSIKVDSSGNVWVGSKTGGVGKFNGTSWTTWTTSNSSLSSNAISQIAEDNSGRIWFTSINDIEISSKGGASIYDPAADEWTYYSKRNSEDEFDDIRKVFFLGDDLWATTGNYADGFLILDQNDLKATIYGQVDGETLDAAGVMSADSSRSASAASTKKSVKIYMIKKGSKNVRARLVYKGKTSGGWYKALNLKVGNKYKIKVQGQKGKNFKLRSGEPVRLDF